MVPGFRGVDPQDLALPARTIDAVICYQRPADGWCLLGVAGPVEVKRNLWRSSVGRAWPQAQPNSTLTCAFPRGAGRPRTCDRRIMSPLL